MVRHTRCSLLLFLLPAHLAVAVIILWPLVQTVRYSLTNYSGRTAEVLETGLSVALDMENGFAELRVAPGSAAERAGLTSESVIVGITPPPDPETGEPREEVRLRANRGDLMRLRHLRAEMENVENELRLSESPDRPIAFTVLEGEGERQIELRAAPRAVQWIPPPALGLSFHRTSSRDPWTLQVRPEFPAEDAGLRSGDELVELGGLGAGAIEDADEALRQELARTQREGAELAITVAREGSGELEFALPGTRTRFALDPPPGGPPEDLAFVGLHHYHRILVPSRRTGESAIFYKHLMQTVIWTVVCVLFHFVLGLGLAILLNKNIRGRALYRIVLLLPWAIPVFVSTFIWRMLFDQAGVVNTGLAQIGIDPVPWLSSPGWTLTACIVVNVWLGVPFMMTVLLGGLQSIPSEMYEAARVDGAGVWQQFVNVTMPLLKPVAVTATLLGVIWTFNMFNVIYLMQGGQRGGVEILATLAFNRFYSVRDFGLAAAHGVIILLILLTFAGLYLRTLRANERVWQ